MSFTFGDENYLNFVVIMHYRWQNKTLLKNQMCQRHNTEIQEWKTRGSTAVERNGLTNWPRTPSIYLGRSF